MKKLAVFAIVLVALSGCKTTESNYKAAYDATMAHRAESTGLDADELSAINRENTPRMVLVTQGDSVPMLTMRLGYVGREGVVPQYCVAAGQFKQKFNAQALCNRLKNLGYEEAFVASTIQETYVAVAAAFPDIVNAAALYHKLVEATRLTPPYPIVVKVP